MNVPNVLINGQVSMPSSVTLPRCVQHDIVSTITKRKYRIFVYKPEDCANENFPAVFMADGNLCFPIAATMAATFEMSGKPAFIIGIGYQSSDPKELMSLRTRDLTPPTPLLAIPQRDDQPPISENEFGGSELFFRFITEELRPVLMTIYPISESEQTLYGHSWGGLFTVETMLKYPKSFKTFVISSPSLWWNNKSVLVDLEDMIEKIEKKKVEPRILMMVGEHEEDAPKTLPKSMKIAMKKKLPFLPEPIRNQIATIFIRRMMKSWAMVKNISGVAARLSQVRGGPGYQVQFRIIENDDHLTVLGASISQGLAFALNYK